jgi:hypothetical protein
MRRPVSVTRAERGIITIISCGLRNSSASSASGAATFF